MGVKHYSYRDFEMYARKIPLLQVLKYMPKSIELQNAIAISNAAEMGQHAVIDGEFVTIKPIDGGPADTPQAANDTGEAAQTARADAPRKRRGRGAAQTGAGDASAPPAKFEDVKAAVKSAETREALEEAARDIGRVHDAMQRTDLEQLYSARAAGFDEEDGNGLSE